MRFPLHEERTDLGRILVPQVPVGVGTPLGFETFLFLLDTGADFTMLPASFAHRAGLDPGRLPRRRVYGIEKAGVVVRVGRLRLRIGAVSFEATALFSPLDTSPLILGRQGFFDSFSIRFDNRRKVMHLTPI